MSEIPCNRRILVIDDNPAIHEDFRKILCTRLPGEQALAEAAAALFGETEAPSADRVFELESAFQGKEGLERVAAGLEKGKPYAMTFLDVRMPPGWDGIETAERLWEKDPDLQIVLCTAYSDYPWDEVRERLGRSDQLLILKKPFDNVEALQLADALTEKWRLTKQAMAQVADLEELIESRTRELAQAQKLEAIGQLSAGIAHEINTPTQFIGDNVRFLQESVGEVLGIVERLVPLVAIDGSAPITAGEIAALLESADIDYLRDEVPKAIAQSLEGVERISKIVGAMKEFSHPATEKTLYDLNRAIANTITVATNEWKYVAVIETHFDSSLPPIPVMPGAFNQVILNILVNAAHAVGEVVAATPDAKGVITVSTRALPDFAEIRIQDSGCGIPDAIRERIFDPFFTTKAVGKGTGQGLAIAHDVIVTKHQGTIAVEGEQGLGTTFVLRLPLDAVVSGVAAVAS
jgi:two-component system NtrC family sensor kinase